MNEILIQLISEMNCNSGAPESVLKKLQLDLGISLPFEYVDFLVDCNGAEGDIGSSYLVLWPVEEIILLNEEFGVHEFAPGLLLFGSDGGGEGYAFDTRLNPMPVVEVPFVGMDHKYARMCGQTFTEFLEFLYNRG